MSRLVTVMFDCTANAPVQLGMVNYAKTIDRNELGQLFITVRLNDQHAMQQHLASWGMNPTKQAIKGGVRLTFPLQVEREELRGVLEWFGND